MKKFLYSEKLQPESYFFPLHVNAPPPHPLLWCLQEDSQWEIIMLSARVVAALLYNSAQGQKNPTTSTLDFNGDAGGASPFKHALFER